MSLYYVVFNFVRQETIEPPIDMTCPEYSSIATVPQQPEHVSDPIKYCNCYQYMPDAAGNQKSIYEETDLL